MSLCHPHSLWRITEVYHLIKVGQFWILLFGWCSPVCLRNSSFSNLCRDPEGYNNHASWQGCWRWLCRQRWFLHPLWTSPLSNQLMPSMTAWSSMYFHAHLKNYCYCTPLMMAYFHYHSPLLLQSLSWSSSSLPCHWGIFDLELCGDDNKVHSWVGSYSFSLPLLGVTYP